MTRWFDNLTHSVTPGPGQPQEKRPPAAALGLTRSGYFNNEYFAPAASVASGGAVDLAKVKEVGNCPGLPPATQMMYDFETLLAPMATYSGLVQPAADRLKYQRAVADSMGAMRATTRGGTCQYMPYQSVLGLGAHDFGATWINAYVSAIQTIFLEPVPGAPNGIGNLFETKLVSVYRRYSDWNYDRQRIAWLASVLRQVYPGARICAGINPRIVASDAGNRRYDYLSRAEMTDYLAVVLDNFDDVAIWCWNGYGPEGTPASQRNSAGYAIVPGTTATVNGDGWHEDAGWWQAVKSKMRGPQNDTMQYNQSGGVQFVGPRVR